MLRRAVVLATVAFLFVLTSTVAMATAQRTFVASAGNDANPCSLVMPCRTFGAAMAQTLSGGEIIVLDSAGYGLVTIAQSVSIIAPAGIFAGITVPAGQTGVEIAGGEINVVLRGLTVNSTGQTGYGIRLTNGWALSLDNCVISNFIVGYGVSIETEAAVRISGTVISNNAMGVVAGFGATVNIHNSQVVGIITEGIETVGDSGTSTSIFITDTLVTGSGGAKCIDNFVSTGAGNISATRVTVTGCLAAFLNDAVGVGTMTVSNSMVTGNSFGFNNVTGTFNSLGTSQVSGNQFDTSGTITTIGGK